MSSFKMTGTDPDPAKSDYQGADRDPALTRPIPSDPIVQTSTAAAPDVSAADTLGNVRPAYAADNVEEIDQDPGDQGAVAPGHSPNAWVGNETADGVFRSADPYRNQGLSGPSTDRGYLENQ